MHVTTMAKLANASKRTGLSITKLIVQLMYHYAKEHKSTYFAKGTVKYQKRDILDHWSFFRVSLKEKDYELFTDMRKVMKKSVSYLIALAVKKYLDRFVTKIIKKVMKYTRLIRRSAGERVEGFMKWMFKWRITTKPPLENETP